MEARPETEGHVANSAVGGTPAAALPGQARAALNQVPAPQLVIIQTIDNDIRCDGTDEEHIPAFGASIAEALDIIVNASPESRILIVSQPGRPRNYALAVASEPQAKAGLTGDGICDMYDPSGALNEEHVQTLASIIESYEAEQNRVCANVPQCSDDEGALAAYQDDVDNFVPGDWNHLNIQGHARIAELIWPRVAEVLGL